MKLRKLQLSGFKSFADRTEFEFHDGISCVVGPNGCGKSNIVDAVKWVLGEQSAKSLRGSEMVDVIFNGSGGRKPGSSAEVTLIFDNPSQRLRLPGADGEAAPTTVAVTRRLFRDGTSEYLINKAAARLRDIREMFMDTGVGVDAYSLIEQGRVESFLQASQEDRRNIFDEAAGISKYKARRKEASRKLERVDQNLLRLTDILGEVDKRLRSIKYQAGKARNYQQYTQQLKELRSLHLLAQYHSHTAQRDQLRQKLDAGTAQMASATSQVEQLESSRSSTEVELADLERTAREVQGRIAAVGGLIAASLQRAEMLDARVKELTEQLATGNAQCQELSGKIEACQAQIASHSGEMDQLEAQLADLNARYDAARQDYTNGELALTKLAAQLEDEKAGSIDLLRRTAQLHNEIQGLGIRRENLQGQKSRLSARAAEIDKTLQDQTMQRSQADSRLGEIRKVLSDAQHRHEETRQARGKLLDTEQTLQSSFARAREQRSGVVSRMNALKEMQQRLEGVGSGVRRVLQARAGGKLPQVLGMLGEYLETDVTHAPLVEAALAGADQQLLVQSIKDLQACQGPLQAALGDNASVEILCLDRLPALRSDFDLPASGVEHYGILGRITDFVRSDAIAAPAVWRLLGTTLIAKTLADAAAASADVPVGYRFVTLDGQVLEADGRVRIGSARHAAGVITRRSELAELAVQLRQLEAEIEQLDQKCRDAKLQRQHLEEVDQSLRQAIYEANTERVECESRLSRLDEQIASLQREQPLVLRDIARMAEEIETTVQGEQQARAKAAELDQLSAQRQQEVERLTAQIAADRQRQQELSGRLTEVKVAMAQTQEKKRALTDAQAALARHRDALEKDLDAAKSQIELNTQRQEDAERGIGSARAEAQRQRQDKETLEVEATEIEESRTGLNEKMEQVRTQLGALRRLQEELVTAVNALRVELGEVDVRIENLIGRANDEMGMNLIDLYGSYQHDEGRDWAAVEAEIADLRGKIERLGNVNIDAIAEQDELEKRGKFLTEQVQDIKNSQQQLDDLIHRLNKESREMFLATFETIRTNFQELFRKLFGGGKADILLANPDDVLESPIDIVARPPGKETRSLSLLSGGEKTMTALSLLFSIFRSRPSPFCLLDEVDAALDEANNRRFGMLLKEFVQTSQFIVVSHSKRTMSLADVLYGVTMQEPGVSKQISVKFEEVASKPDGELQPA